MMVLYKGYFTDNTCQRDLTDLLTPYSNSGGQVEQAMDLAEKNAKMIGGIAALLVEKKILSLEEVFALTGDYGEVSLLPDDPLTDLRLD